MKERKYKFGFVGMNDMSIRTIDECFYQIRNGANIKQGTVEGGYPITRIETTANDRFNRDRMGYAGITDIEKYESYILQDGDLLMSHINSVQYLGRTVLYEKQGNEKIIHGMNLLGLKARRDIIIPAYARYCFYSYSFRQQIGRITKKSVNQASFAVADLKKIKIKVPDLSEQSRVVDILNRLNQVIEDRQQELQKLDDLTKARFVELFGNPIKNEKHWETFKLGECLKCIDNGKSFTCDVQARTGECPAILKLSAVTYGDYRPEENKALLDEKQFVESTEVHSGDLLFTRKNTPELVGMAAYVYNTPNHLMMPDLIFRLVPNERMTAIFLWQLINNREFRPVIQSIAGGSAKSMSNISKERLNNISVICPPINEQIRLNEMINQVNKSKVAVLKKLFTRRCSIL